MAGAVVNTQTVVPRGAQDLVGSVAQGGKQVVKTSIAWTSDAAGAVSGNATVLPSGTVVGVTFIPGAGGVQPTDLYDVTFTDAAGINAFNDGAGVSIGANLSNTLATEKIPFIGGAASTFVRAWLEGGSYTLVVAAAGNAKQGTVVIFQTLDVI